MTRHLHIEPLGGASGDMFLGMLLDLGVDPQRLAEVPRRLGLDTVVVECGQALRAGLAAGRVVVRPVNGEDDLDRHAPEPGHGRHLKDCLEILRRADLPERCRELAARAIHLLYAAEAKVHGEEPETVHLHEAGADDALVDIAGSCLAVELLGIGRITCGLPIPVGSGTVRCAHGDMPVPVPAVTSLLAGLQVEPGPVRRERVTPTGAALLRALVDEFGPMPRLELARTGMGAGGADTPERPNVMRGLVGVAAEEPGAGERTVTVLECAVDDILPQDVPVWIDRLLAAGARDAFVQPVIMKKGRPGFRLTVVGDPGSEEKLAAIVLREGSTLGVRVRRERRFELARDVVTVDTPWGAVRVKRALDENGATLRGAPEFDDVKRLADETGRPVEEIRRAALDALRADTRHDLSWSESSEEVRPVQRGDSHGVVPRQQRKSGRGTKTGGES